MPPDFDPSLDPALDDLEAPEDEFSFDEQQGTLELLTGLMGHAAEQYAQEMKGRHAPPPEVPEAPVPEATPVEDAEPSPEELEALLAAGA